MNAHWLTSLLALGVAAGLVAPACSSSSDDLLGAGGDGSGGDPAQAGNTTVAGQTNQAGAGGAGDVKLDAGGSGHGGQAGDSSENGGSPPDDLPRVEVDADGCPVGSYRDAADLRCDDVGAECPKAPDCGGGWLSLLRCVQGVWHYNYNESDCITCEESTIEGDQCTSFEEGDQCTTRTQTQVGSDDCLLHATYTCHAGAWETKQIFSAPCAENGAGGMGGADAGGASGGAGGAP